MSVLYSILTLCIFFQLEEKSSGLVGGKVLGAKLNLLSWRSCFDFVKLVKGAVAWFTFLFAFVSFSLCNVLLVLPHCFESGSEVFIVFASFKLFFILTTSFGVDLFFAVDIIVALQDLFYHEIVDSFAQFKFPFSRTFF